MAIGKRSLMNEHMIAVLNKVSSMSPEPVQKSYLYYSQAEKEAVDYMIAVDLLKETTYIDSEGKEKKGYVLGDFGKDIARDIITLQMRLNLQERISEDPEKSEIARELQTMRSKLNSAAEEGSAENVKQLREQIEFTEKKLMADYQKTVDMQIQNLDSRGNRKMETINKWKQQRKTQ